MVQSGWFGGVVVFGTRTLIIVNNIKTKSVGQGADGC